MFKVKAILLLFSLVISLKGMTSPNLEQANGSVEKAFQATTWYDREVDLNRALTLYLDLESSAANPSRELHCAIGRIYEEFRLYPWALLEYNKALRLEPRNSLIKERIKENEKKIGIDQNAVRLVDYFNPRNWISLSEQNLGLLIGFTLLFIFLSLSIWKNKKEFQMITTSLLWIILLLLITLLISSYFSPIEGLLVNPTGLYREPGLEHSQITPVPLKAGLKIKILSTENNGEWLKISDPSGLVGYVPISTTRLL